MDGREAMAMPSHSSYYLHRGLGNPSPGTHAGLHGPQIMRSITSPRPPFGGQSIGGSSGFQLESQSSIATMSMITPRSANVSGSVGGNGSGSGSGSGSRHSGMGQGETVKRKRGRPRKYGPDGGVALALSPLSSVTPGSGSVVPSISGNQSGSGTPKRGRGRPPGTGRKQQLASLGEWFSGSAGMGFTPHVVTIAAGEDIAAKIMSFSQLGPRAICILSATGAVSIVTLRQLSTGGTITYEGRFEILVLSGLYLPTDNGGSRTRTGGLSISLSNPDGRVIGGAVGGFLIAATPVQVVVGSFTCAGARNRKTVQESVPGSEFPTGDGPQGTPAGSMPTPTGTEGWPVPRQTDTRNSHFDIDLTRG